jgi:hypothetical protein
MEFDPFDLPAGMKWEWPLSVPPMGWEKPMVGTTIVAGFLGEHLVATDLFIRSTSSWRPQTHSILFCRTFTISQPNYTSQSCNNRTKPISPIYAVCAVHRPPDGALNQLPSTDQA